MADNGMVERVFTLGSFNSTFTIDSKMGVKAVSIRGLDANDVEVTANVTTLGGQSSTPLTLNENKPTLTIAALQNGSYLDGITIDCSAGTADIICFI